MITTFHATEEMKAEGRRKYMSLSTDLADTIKIQPVKSNRKVKSYTWSKEAKARNRRKRLKERIMKKYKYNPEYPGLFEDEVLNRINTEYQEKIMASQAYFDGETVNLYE